MRINNRDIQRVLKAAGYYKGKIDGDLGAKSRAGISSLLENRSSEVSDPHWREWDWSRKAVAAVQMILKFAGFEPGDVDGLYGTLSHYAFENWKHEKTHGVKLPTDWRDDDIEPINDGQKQFLQRTDWPHQRDMTRVFGEPGGPQCTAGKVQLPFAMRIAWNKSQVIRRFSCHEMVADSAQRVYERIASAYSPEDITRLGFDLFGGCYNFRKKRGGRTLSTHAYGIAIDHDPERNQLRWNADRAKLATAECREFWECWEAEGWLSLGRARDFDWMHVQAARI